MGRTEDILGLLFDGTTDVEDKLLCQNNAKFFGCLLLGFVPIGPIRRRLRRRRAHPAEDQDGHAETVDAKVAAGRRASAAVNPRVPELDSSPRLVSPLTAAGRAPRLAVCIGLAAACGAVAMVVMQPGWAPVVAGATAVAALVTALWSRARSTLSLSALGCMTAAGAVTVFDQLRHRYQAGSSWPHHFETAGVLAMVAVVLLATDAAVELARLRHTPDDYGTAERASGFAAARRQQERPGPPGPSPPR